MAQLDSKGFEVVSDTVTEGYDLEGITYFTWLSQPVNRVITVDYKTTDGTATAGQDYTATQATASIPSGQTRTADIKISILDDNLNEIDETFTVDFFNLSEGRFVTDSATFTITDTLRTPVTNTLPEKVENLTLTGIDSISGTGNSGINVLTGNDANNTLEGKEKNDFLLGKDGDDTLIGFGGSLPGAGEIDELTGGAGKDTFVVGSSTLAYSSATKFAVTSEQLKAITGGRASDISKYLPSLNAAMLEFDIITPLRQQAFIAQISKESGSLRYNSELWGPTAAQKRYEPPSAKAKELGNTQKGDGYRYRGRGLIQLTGRANYRTVGQALGLGRKLEKNPDLVLRPDLAARVSTYFWKSRGLNELADAGNFAEITKRITGCRNFNKCKYVEYNKRLAFYEKAKQEITWDAKIKDDVDYALIKDFTPPEDVIRLSGSPSDYLLQPFISESTLASGSVVIHRSSNNIVGIIEGRNDLGTNLNISYFQFS